MEERGREENQRKRCHKEAGSERCYVDDIEDGGRGPQTKEFWWCLEARRAKETTSKKEPSPLRHLNFSPMRLTSAFCTVEMFENKLVFFWTTKFLVISNDSNRNLLQPLFKEILGDLETFPATHPLLCYFIIWSRDHQHHLQNQ